jgi:carbamoyltransferase
VTEEIMLRCARHVQKETGQEYLCLSGGVALNCVGNGRILRESPFRDIWIQPASSDAGGALGAALLTWHQYLGKDREADETRDSQHGSYLGPEYSNEQIQQFLRDRDIEFTELSDTELSETVADLIAQEKVIGWFQGRMEFGPRALGNRSIIGDPRSATMQGTINHKIKFRESFRPFAPSVLKERVSDYFQLGRESPYMLLVAPVNKAHRREEVGTMGATGLDLLKVVRSDIPAVTHVDYSARIQTVSREDNPRFHDLIAAFERKHGCPLVINTSFNVRGEPIVCTPEEAYACFMRTQMDYLIMGNFLIEKTRQQQAASGETPMPSIEPD